MALLSDEEKAAYAHCIVIDGPPVDLQLYISIEIIDFESLLSDMVHVFNIYDTFSNDIKSEGILLFGVDAAHTLFETFNDSPCISFPLIIPDEYKGADGTLGKWKNALPVIQECERYNVLEYKGWLIVDTNYALGLEDYNV